MPAARYWRITGIDTTREAGLELSAVHLHDPSGARADTAATLYCAFEPTDGLLANLQDTTAATTCRFSEAQVRSSGFALVWDFGGAPADIGGVRLGAGTSIEQWVGSLTLEYFTSGIWQVLSRFGAYPWPGALALTVVSAASDPLYQKVELLLHGNDAPGSTTLVDSSLSPKTVTATGGAATAAFASAFGGSAIKFSGAGVVQVAHNSAFDFSVDWCVEMIFWPSSSGSAQMLFNKAFMTDPGYPVQFFMQADRTILARSYDAASTMLWSIPGSTALALNARNTIAVSRSGSTFRLFVNGGLDGSATYAGPAPSNTNAISIGAYSHATYSAYGHIEEVRLTFRDARRTAPYIPDASAFSDFETGGQMDAERTRTAGLRSAVAASAAVPTHSATIASRLQLARDVEYGGLGTIYGTTKTKGTPNTPTKARVVLLCQRSKQPVRETWSDPVTGAFVFTGIDTTQQFLTLAEDAAGNFRPVAANRLTPEVLA